MLCFVLRPSCTMDYLHPHFPTALTTSHGLPMIWRNLVAQWPTNNMSNWILHSTSYCPARKRVLNVLCSFSGQLLFTNFLLNAITEVPYNAIIENKHILRSKNTCNTHAWLRTFLLKHNLCLLNPCHQASVLTPAASWFCYSASEWQTNKHSFSTHKTNW